MEQEEIGLEDDLPFEKIPKDLAQMPHGFLLNRQYFMESKSCFFFRGSYNVEPKNHPFAKENHLRNLHYCVQHIDFTGCILNLALLNQNL